MRTRIGLSNKGKWNLVHSRFVRLCIYKRDWLNTFTCSPFPEISRVEKLILYKLEDISHRVKSHRYGTSIWGWMPIYNCPSYFPGYTPKANSTSVVRWLWSQNVVFVNPKKNAGLRFPLRGTRTLDQPLTGQWPTLKSYLHVCPAPTLVALWLINGLEIRTAHYTALCILISPSDFCHWNWFFPFAAWR